MSGLVHFLTATEVVSGSISIISLAGVITAPVGLALGGITVGLTTLSFGLNFGKKNISKKISKHEQINTLAVSKLTTVNDMISKSLTDYVISSDEFSLTVQEKEKYITLKNKIRIDHRNSTDEQLNTEELKAKLTKINRR